MNFVQQKDEYHESNEWLFINHFHCKFVNIVIVGQIKNIEMLCLPIVLLLCYFYKALCLQLVHPTNLIYSQQFGGVEAAKIIMSHV